MNASIVPVLAETRSKSGHEAFSRLASALVFWMAGILLAVCTIGVLFTPLVVHLAAPGFSQDPEKYRLTVQLTRWIFPAIFLVGMSALMMGILNTLKSFASSAAGPGLLNLSMIAALFYLAPQWGVYGLIVGVWGGVVLQCGIQLLSFKGSGFRMTRPDFVHPAAKKILKLMGPRVWGSAVYQVSVFVDTILASFYWIVGQGGQSALYYSSRLFQLPIALFVVSFAQAALPTLSGHHAKNEVKAFREAVVFSLKQIGFGLIPASLGLAVFARPIVTVLFERGAFDAYSSQVTSDALFYYSLGLMSCGMIKFLASVYYALQDTRTPVKMAAWALASNVILNLLLMGPLKIGGLALATTLSGTLNAFLLFKYLRPKMGSLSGQGLGSSWIRSSLAAALMALIGLVLLKPWINGALATGAVREGTIRLALSLALSMLLYFGSALLLRSEEARRLSAWLGRFNPFLS